MKIFNTATEPGQAGGTRRGANMGDPAAWIILTFMEFITCKMDTRQS